MMDASNDVIEQLAPTGKLRAEINLGNFLLVSGKNARGEPTGVAPDMARILAARLGVPIDKAGALGFLSSFVDASLASGLVADLIAKHGIIGLSAAK